MRTKLLTAEFYNYLKMIVEYHKLDPKNTYVEITWWNNVFRPLITTDCDRSRDSKYIMVFGDTLCNTCGKNNNGEVIPSGFWIYNDAYCVEQVVHRPLTLDKIFDAKCLSDFDTVEFLFSNSPVNYCVDINPFRTKIYKNGNGETILSFYVDDRDSGEWKHISEVKPEYIKVISES
jgi:hypothetical protein